MRVPAMRSSAMPMDEASIAQAPKPCFTMSAKLACSTTGSGVVRPVKRMWPSPRPGTGGVPTPSVPTSPQGRSSMPRACAVHQALEVLPLVPVTATTFSASLGRPK